MLCLSQLNLMTVIQIFLIKACPVRATIRVTSHLPAALVTAVQHLLSNRQLDFILTYSKVRFPLFFSFRRVWKAEPSDFACGFQCPVCTYARAGHVVESWSFTGRLMYSSSSPLPRAVSTENQTAPENWVVGNAQSQALMLPFQLPSSENWHLPLCPSARFADDLEQADTEEGVEMVSRHSLRVRAKEKHPAWTLLSFFKYPIPNQYRLVIESVWIRSLDSGCPPSQPVHHLCRSVQDRGHCRCRSGSFPQGREGCLHSPHNVFGTTRVFRPVHWVYNWILPT